MCLGRSACAVCPWEADTCLLCATCTRHRDHRAPGEGNQRQLVVLGARLKTPET